MELFKDKLIHKLEGVNDYLSSKQERKADFSSLIDEINEIIDIVKRKKITIKLFSQTANLAKTVKLNLKKDRDFYQFTLVVPEKPINEIVKYCELICFVYDNRQIISERDRLLMMAAREANVDCAILVINIDLDNNSESLATWIEKQDGLGSEILLPVNSFFNLDVCEDLEAYDRFIKEQSIIWFNRFIERINTRLYYKIQKYFESAKKTTWQTIQEYKNNYTNGEPPDTFKKQLDRSLQKLNKQQQQTFRKIKQLVNQSKSDLTNSFVSNSLMFDIQDIVQQAEVKIIKQQKQTYLYLAVNKQTYSQTIHLYLAEILQQRLDNWLTEEWQKIDRQYDRGGLNDLRQTIVTDLSVLTNLYPENIQLKSIDRNSFKLSDFVSFSILEDTSRNIFDYSFTQSSWFRLLMSVAIGMVIFLVTKLIFGTGKYFGFVILFFQVINLLTGQDIKKIKLKQQTKELKRNIETKYQLLARSIVDRLIQDINIILDDENYYYQQQIDEIIKITDEKLFTVKTLIQENKDHLARQESERNEIYSLLE
jgi:flagellar hook-basal body complex protein FliE